jgi:hypothetical protein
MNSKMDFGLSTPTAKGLNSAGRTMLALAFLALLVVAAVAVLQGRTVVERVAPSLAEERFLAENPELKAARGYPAQASAAVTDRAFLAQNPEFSAVRRNNESLNAAADRAFLAQNPELSAAARFVAANAEPEHTFLAQNPELKLMRRYAELRASE